MSRTRREKGVRPVCMACGATTTLVNCPPEWIQDPCPGCGQCKCLQRDWEEDE